ncbi:MAG: PorT family protein [Sphingobacteriales bacterium]|nr:MAG: PorT family protein [Sphingobacteriales bacterium]
MKKYVLFGCALMIMGQANAQEQSDMKVGKREPMFGVEFGGNLNNMLNNYQGETVSNQLKVGVHAGFVADVLLTSHVYLQPGLRYIMKGGQNERSNETLITGGTMRYERKDKVTLNYVSLPVNLVYKFGGENGGFFIGAGGYAAALVDARTKFKEEMTTKVANESDVEVKADGSGKLAIGNTAGQDDITRMDYGVQGLLGVELNNNWYIKGTVEAGLRNVFSGGKTSNVTSVIPSTNASGKNISYLLTVGYMFER